MIWSWEPIHIFRWIFFPFLDFVASNRVASPPSYPEARGCPVLHWLGSREPILTKLQGSEAAGFPGALASDLRDGTLGPCFGLAFARSGGVCELMQPHELSCQPVPGEWVPCCLQIFFFSFHFHLCSTFYFLLSNIYFRIRTSGWLTDSVNVASAGWFWGQD